MGQILDLKILVRAQDPKWLRITRAFLDVYETDSQPEAVRRLQVNVRCGADERWDADGPEVPIHRSTHLHWNFSGTRLADDRRTVLWRDKGIIASITGTDKLEIVVNPDANGTVVGEAVFHAIRSTALYLRSPALGRMTHAAAVGRDGRAVLFLGASFSGKSTVAMHAIAQMNAQPLANDRVVITDESTPRALSWPSYTSLCEGTILAFPSLMRMERLYESDECAYRTRRWRRRPTERYSVTSKRVYPPEWLVEAFGRKFARALPLGAVLSVRVDSAFEEPELQALELETEAGRSELARALKDNGFAQEPSFLPWHGLLWPREISSERDIAERCRRAQVRAGTLRLAPSHLPGLGSILAGFLAAPITRSGPSAPDRPRP